jgi:hypothetical protein
MKTHSSTVPQCGIQNTGHAPGCDAIASAMARRKYINAGAAAVLAAALASPAWAVDIDCTKHLHAAQASIDKVVEDMKGMEMMPKSQLADVHVLLNEAKKLVQGAQRDCGPAHADADRARSLAQADAAKGYATAADMLHWQYMKPMHGSGAMPGMQMKSSSASGASTMIGMQNGASDSDTPMPQMHEHTMHVHSMSMGK